MGTSATVPQLAFYSAAHPPEVGLASEVAELPIIFSVAPITATSSAGVEITASVVPEVTNVVAELPGSLPAPAADASIIGLQDPSPSLPSET